MKIIIAGGSGHLGDILLQHFQTKKHEVRVLTRSKSVSLPYITWNVKTLGKWQNEIDGSDVVINLAGRSVNCRYHSKNLKEMMDSRVNSTHILGQAISKAKKPPKLWLQMSTATIYAHSFDKDNDEYTGIIGGNEPNVPDYWSYSIEIAKAWEKALIKFKTPFTRKIIMRTAMVMSTSKKGVFNVLLSLTRMRLGGAINGGQQYVSWIHASDFIRAIEFFITKEDIKGIVNLSSPKPIKQLNFMASLRSAWGIRIGLPATRWMAEVGAFFLRTDTELILKSRRVVPTKLINLGFKFEFSSWESAVKNLVSSFKS